MATGDCYASDFASPELALLFGQLDDAARRLYTGLRRLPQPELEYRGPEGNRNSIATLVVHIAAVYLDYLYEWYQGLPVPDALRERYRTELQDDRLQIVEGLTPEQLIELHQAALDMLRAFWHERSPADLNREIVFSEERRVTWRWSLWHMAEHVMVHMGHMGQLHRAWQASQTPNP